MANQILKATRRCPAEGMEGVVFRHPRYGPVEVVQVLNEPMPGGVWEVTLWVTDAAPHKKAFLEDCEANLDFVLQSFAARDAACA